MGLEELANDGIDELSEDVEFYARLKAQEVKEDVPILREASIAYANHFARKYDSTIEELETMSRSVHYRRQYELTKEVGETYE